MSKDVMVRAERKTHEIIAAYASIQRKRVKTIVDEALLDYINNKISKEDLKAINQMIKRRNTNNQTEQ